VFSLGAEFMCHFTDDVDDAVHDIYKVNIAEILAVTTLYLVDTFTKYTLPSPLHKAACG